MNDINIIFQIGSEKEVSILILYTKVPKDGV